MFERYKKEKDRSLTKSKREIQLIHSLTLEFGADGVVKEPENLESPSASINKIKAPRRSRTVMVGSTSETHSPARKEPQPNELEIKLGNQVRTRFHFGEQTTMSRIEPDFYSSKPEPSLSHSLSKTARQRMQELGSIGSGPERVSETGIRKLENAGASEADLNNPLSRISSPNLHHPSSGPGGYSKALRPEKAFEQRGSLTLSNSMSKRRDREFIFLNLDKTGQSLASYYQQPVVLDRQQNGCRTLDSLAIWHKLNLLAEQMEALFPTNQLYKAERVDTDDLFNQICSDVAKLRARQAELEQTNTILHQENTVNKQHLDMLAKQLEEKISYLDQKISRGSSQTRQVPAPRFHDPVAKTHKIGYELEQMMKSKLDPRQRVLVA